MVVSARDASAQQLGAQSRDCGAAINRAISVFIAEPNKADYSMCHINISPVVFTCKRCFDKRRLLAAIWIAIVFQ